LEVLLLAARGSPDVGAPTNVPAPITSFVGRERELTALAELVGSNRLVSITGAGGSGKTRLAVELARRVASTYQDGAWLVELSGVHSSGLVGPAVCDVMCSGLNDDEPLEGLDRVVAHLSWRRALLVLDNCEQVADECADVVQRILHGCPGITIVATTRQTLGVPGEAVWRVPSLPVPAEETEEPAEYDAVRLFVDRATLARSDFRLTPDNTDVVVRICRRLDGLPLAIELAASRVTALSVAEIEEKLHDGFRLLSDPGSRRPARHRTITATIDWGYDLLDEREQTLLRRLGLFVSSFRLEDVAAVCGLDEPDPLDALESLVRASFVVAETSRDQTTYSLLASVRDYALQRLEASGEMDEQSAKHAEWFTALAMRAGPELRGANQARWLDTIESELGNIRVALEVANDATVLAVATALRTFWEARGRLAEGRTWLEAALEREDDVPALCAAASLCAEQSDLEAARGYAARAIESAVSSGERADALECSARVAWLEGDYARAQSLGEQSRDAANEAGVTLVEAAAVGGLAQVAWVQGDYPRVRELAESALELHRIAGDAAGAAAILHILSAEARETGDFARARSLSREGLDLSFGVGDRRGAAAALAALGVGARMEEDLETAKGFYDESLALARELADPNLLGDALNNSGELMLQLGDPDAGQALLTEAITLLRRAGARHQLATALANFGHVFRGTDPSARDAMHESLTIFRELGASNMEATVLGNLGTQAAEAGDDESARRFHDESLVIFRELGAKPYVARSLLYHAELAERAGDRDRAAECLEERAALLKELDAQVELARCVEDLARLRGDPRDPSRVVLLRLEGEYWTLSRNGNSMRFRDAKGLRYLRTLLDNPGREIRAAALAGEPGVAVVSESDAGPVLDGAAKDAYRRRIAELEEEVAEADEWNDMERASRARAELDALRTELASAVGLGGRDRRGPSADERARQAVTKRIVAAIRKIAQGDPSLGDYLSRTIRTGVVCAYIPDTDAPLEWPR
jgi:non-specific serine/threonine protein kinase